MLHEQNTDSFKPAKTADLGYEPPKRGASQLVVVLGVLFMLAALGFAGYLLTGGSERVSVGPMEQIDEESAVTVSTIDGEPEQTTTSEPVPQSTEATEAEVLTTTTVRSTTEVTGIPVAGSLSDDRIDLTGVVPSAEVGESFVSLFEDFVGADNVGGEFTITEGAPVPNSFRLQIIDSVLFGAGGEEVQPEFFPLLDQVATFMTADPNITLVVEGHTDSDGNPVANLALSQRRAEAVLGYIEQQGINSFRLEALGRGDTDPVADNDTADGRQQNRRIELVLIGLRDQMS